MAANYGRGECWRARCPAVCGLTGTAAMWPLHLLPTQQCCWRRNRRESAFLARCAVQPSCCSLCAAPFPAASTDCSLQRASPVLHPLSCIPRPASPILHPLSCMPHPACSVLHPSSCMPHPASHILHPAACTPHPTCAGCAVHISVCRDGAVHIAVLGWGCPTESSTT